LKAIAHDDRIEVKKESILVGRPSVLRHTNALSILKLLRESDSCSKADLVRATGLSAPTVTNVVNDLISVDLIEPLGEGESSGGRPPDMLRFKTERGCILAADVTAIGISFLLTDLNGNKLETLKLSFDKRRTTPDAICEYIVEALKTLLRKQRKTREQLMALVVGVPAITNVDEGSVVSISTLTNWRSVPLRTMLNKSIDCLVIIENDTNLAALGEQYRGAAQAELNFVFISLGANVGAGIILGGRVHHGSHWSAGEIGYLRLPYLSRKQPTLHEFGELETILTNSGFLKSWKERNRSLRQDNKGTEKEIDAVEILNLAQAGDSSAEELVHRRAGMVADIVINLSLILNPSLIVLGGPIGSHPMLIHSVRKQLQGSEFAVPQVTAGALGESAVLWGGIALALEAVPSVLLPLPTS
jgi:glucokinase